MLRAGADAEGPPIEIAAPDAAGGRLTYGDLLEFDFDADQIHCLGCRAELGSARGDFRLGCLVERTPVTAQWPG